MNGLDFKKLVCEVYDGELLKETIEQDVQELPNWLKFMKESRDWLEMEKNIGLKLMLLLKVMIRICLMN